MGEIADAMVDGELCQECGTYIGEGVGYPRSCRGCQRGAIVTARSIPRGVLLACPNCGRKCKGQEGLRDHQRAKHATP